MLKLIKDLLTSNFTALVIAVIIAFITVIFSKNAQILSVIFIASIIAILIIIYAIIYLIKKRHWGKNLQRNLIYKLVDHDWAISENGDFSANIVYTVKNIGKIDVAVIPFDNGYWLQKPDNLEFQCKVLRSSKDYKIIEYRNHIYDSLVRLFFGVKAYEIAWSHSINPPLAPNDELTFEIKIVTPSSEKDAFSTEGTYAGIPANIPTKQAKLNFSAPNSYKFELLVSKLVLDPNGNRDDNETNHISEPVLNGSRKALTWQLDNLLTGHRYCFKYKMNRE